MVSKVDFEGNTADSGGALGSYGDGAVISVLDSSFRDNSADDGGAITVSGGSVDISAASFRITVRDVEAGRFSPSAEPWT